MKIICWIYFLLAPCLILFPHPCGASSPLLSSSISSSEEPVLVDMEIESPEPSSVGESVVSVPSEMSLSPELEERPVRVAVANVPPAPLKSEEEIETIPDPLEPINRAFFIFNDRLYFWVFKPVAQGYKIIAPEPVRVGVRNFFSNVTTPVRLANCLLQADLKCAGIETARFCMNTALGFLGFFDSAKTGFNLEKQDRDFGQTLGIWGMGPVFYIDLPIIGPSSLRDGLGYGVDIFFDPRTYVAFYFAALGYVNTGGWVLDKVNEASLSLGEYEDLKKAALDPYIALREAYHQYRQSKIRK